MTPSDATNPIWKQLINGQSSAPVTFMAANILLSRLKIEYRHNTSRLDSGARELFELYFKNQQLPSVKRDLPNLIGHA